ncbi:MAG: EamA family transporter [Bacteroidota bacterium]
MEERPKSNERLLIILAFAAIYFIWGSTYLANDWASRDVPHLLMVGMRFLVAGSIMYAYTIWKKAPPLSRQQWRNTAWIGFLFLTMGTGAAVLSLQYVSSSFSALIISFEPMLVMILLWVVKKRKPAGQAWLGAFVSIVGLVLLMGTPELPPWEKLIPGLCWIGTGMLSWGWGLVHLEELDQGSNPIRGVAAQMLTGGAFLLILSSLKGEWALFSVDRISSRGLLAWAYLISFGSIIAYSSFNYLLKRVSPEKVATNTYVNPLVAAILGYSLNNEPFTGRMVVAAFLLLAGVYFINRAK